MPKKSLHLPITSLAILVIASLLAACSGIVPPSGFPGVSANQDTAFLVANQFVYAVNLSNGTQKWRFPADKAVSGLTFFSTPALTSDGQLIVGGYDNKLYSLDLASGTKKWEFAAKDRFVGGALVTPQGIYAPSADGHLYALSYTGNLSWTFTTQGPNWSTPAWSKPATNDQCNCIYLASMDHYLYAINAVSRVQVWKLDLGNAMAGTPAWGPDNTLYIGNFGSQMVAVNAQNGTVRWTTTLPGWVWGGPVLDGNNLYFGDLSGNFYSMQASDGKILNKITSDGAITSSPLVTRDAIYFTTDAGSLYAVNRDLSFKWTPIAVGGKIYSSPVLGGNIILVSPSGTDNVLEAYNPNGGQAWPKFVGAK